MKFGRPKFSRPDRGSGDRFASWFLICFLAVACVVLVVRSRHQLARLVCSTPPSRPQRELATVGPGATEIAQIAHASRRKKVLAVVGVNTGFESFARRKVLRDTWFPSTPQLLEETFDSSGLLFRFVIGKSKDPKLEAKLQEEIALYDDFLRLNITEGYLDLNHKTLAYFKTVFQLYDATWYVKADDDIYLRPDRLGLLLAKDRKSPRVYLGCLKHGDVITDKRFKWYEPQGHLLGKEYFLHAYGPIYALTQDVVHTIATIRDGTLRMFMNEDVTVGSWMLALDVAHEQNLDLCSASCTPRFIAVFDLPACSGLCKPLEKMPLLHRDPKCSGVPNSTTTLRRLRRARFL